MWRGAGREVGRGGMVVMFAVFFAAGCSHSPGERARGELHSVRSWAASARMVGERWTHGAVPDHYATLSLASFVKHLEGERAKASDATLPHDVKAYILSAFDSTTRSTDSLLRVVERGDGAAAVGIVERLGARARAVHSASERLDTK